MNISSYPVYEHILKLGRERPDAVLLHIGCCCCGTWKNIIASNVHVNSGM
ncbi:hypothetical protein EDB19DRAFT_1677098 [Suillus lakei]|nr:hypothetical protein EDB19DRAFT_1677098 [Suillus lakei]